MAEKEWLVIVDGANAWRVKAERYDLYQVSGERYRVDLFGPLERVTIPQDGRQPGSPIASFTGSMIHVLDMAFTVEPPKPAEPVKTPGMSIPKPN